MSHCAPILTYGIEVFEFSRADFQQMRMAYNAIFRKIFGFRRNESVTDIVLSNGMKKWDDLVESRRERFINKKRQSSNVIVASFANS